MNKFLNLAFVAVMLFALAACNKDEDFVPSLTVDKESLQFSYSGGTETLKITSNTNWTVEKDADAEWLTLDKTSGNANASVSVTVTENTAITQRSASITVKTEGLSDLKITVTQSSAAPSLTVDKESLQFSYSGGKDSLAITSNTNWTVEKDADADWFTLDKTSGNANAFVSVTVVENTAFTPRSASITVKSEGLSEVKITVTQKAFETVGLYVLSEGVWGKGNADILYYDLKTETITKKFSQENGKTIGDGANELALYGSKLYCTVSGGTEGYVEVINPETGISIKRIPVTTSGNGPRNIIFHEGKAYVTTYSQSVVRIDTASLEIDKTATLSGTNAEGICLYGGNFYICNSGWGSGTTISVVSLNSFEETETITVPQNPVAIKATAAGEIYFTTSSITDPVTWATIGLSNLHVLDPAQKKVTKTFDIRASKLALYKDFIYVVDSYSENYFEYTDYIHKINLQTKAVEDISSIYEDYYMVYSVSVNPFNGDFYLGNQGDNVVAYDKDNNEKFDFKAKVPYILSVVPIVK